MISKLTQKIDKCDLDYCKDWLCDTTPISVKQGILVITARNCLFARLHECQINHLFTKMMGPKDFEGISVVYSSKTIAVDDIVTIELDFESDKMGSIRSRVQFVKLIYQFMSCFPVDLFKTYTEVTGENLILDERSQVREFYENRSKYDSWSGHQLCAFISHSDPEVIDFMSENPESDIDTAFSPIFSRSDLYEKNAPLVKAAILGGAFDLIHFDRDDWEKSTLMPKKGLEWAKKKGIDYHPVLDEYLLTLDAAPAIASGYTTPYLEMMLEVIREFEITKKNQGKKEAIAASFAKKLMDHKLTPTSQRLADSMATLVRLPESQQGRAKSKG
jgi:hypothetical protein